MYKRYTTLLILVLGIFISAQAGEPEKNKNWDWSKISTQEPHFLDTLAFPKDFIFGVADSAYQTEGAEGPNGKLYENSWTVFEGENSITPAGRGCERWTRYKDDIKLIKQCGFKIYRFSVEWSKIEPEPGIFNQEALDHYKDVCKCLLDEGIMPVICLFHHTWPCWFGDRDGFELTENIELFTEYAQRVIQELSPFVSHWMSFNEPEGYAMQGYYRGEYPPAKRDMHLAGTVLKNMLKAHVEVYQIAKKINSKNSIGFAKIVQPVEAYTWYNPLEVVAAKVANHLMDGCILNFFSTGVFNWSTAGFNAVYYKDTRAPRSLDFLGINYYTHTWLKCLKPAARESEVLSEDGKAVYPEGIYYALKSFSKLNVPLYVAENGVSDGKDTLKNEYIKRHLYAVRKALEEGIDIRGYFYWTLMDNFEWKKGYGESYGLFHVDRNTQKRTLRDGAQEFISYLQNRNTI